jgi:putative endonuclease
MGSGSEKIKAMRVRAERRGHFAEFIAGWWFQLSGYRIMARRWRAATGEIDLVVKRRYLLVFVEVKYRFDSEQIATPSPRQCQRIRSTASLFLARYPNFSDYQCRFDLFIVNHGKFFGVGHIAHIKNAW